MRPPNVHVSGSICQKSISLAPQAGYNRSWPNARLKVAAVVGHATPNSVRLWLRTGRPGEFSLFLYRRDTALPPAGGEAGEATLRPLLNSVPLRAERLEESLPVEQRQDFPFTDYAADTTVVLELQGLVPDTRYGYLLYAGHYNRLPDFTDVNDHRGVPGGQPLGSAPVLFLPSAIPGDRPEVCPLNKP